MVKILQCTVQQLCMKSCQTKIFYYTKPVKEKRYVLVLMVPDIPSIFTIPCKEGDNILFIVEEYFERCDIKIQFDELIPIK